MEALDGALSELNLGFEVRIKAATLFKDLLIKEQKRIKSHYLVMALCLLTVIRESEGPAPIPMQEVVRVFKKLGYQISGRTFFQLYQRLTPIIKRKVIYSEEYISQMIAIVCNDTEVMENIMKNKVNVNTFRDELEKQSNELLTSIDKTSRGGRNPFVFAISIIYTASKIVSPQFKITSVLSQDFLSKKFKVSGNTVRTNWKFIKDYLNIGDYLRSTNLQIEKERTLHKKYIKFLKRKAKFSLNFNEIEILTVINIIFCKKSFLNKPKLKTGSLLDDKQRSNIYNYIKGNSGVNIDEISKGLNINKKQIKNALFFLELFEFVRMKKYFQEKFYFLKKTDTLNYDEMLILKSKINKNILDLINDSDGYTIDELKNKTNIENDEMIKQHLKVLLANKLISSMGIHNKIYYINNRIYKLLHTKTSD